MTTRKAHGPAIKGFRKMLDVSQDELAIVAGISPSHLHRIETGERAASAQVILAIAARLQAEANAKGIKYLIDDNAITYPVEVIYQDNQLAA